MEIELPLAKGTQENLPAIFVLGPSITMGLSSTAMGLFSFWLAAERKQDLLSVVPTLLMSLSMALEQSFGRCSPSVMSESSSVEGRKTMLCVLLLSAGGETA